MKYQYRPPTAEDIISVASRMREEDVLEVFASSGSTPLQALVESVGGVGDSFCFVANDVPQCIFGVAKDSNGDGLVWLLSADSAYKHIHHITRETRRITDGWLDEVPTLYNWVSTKSTNTLIWLELLGFRCVHTENLGFPEEGFDLMEKSRV